MQEFQLFKRREFSTYISDTIQFFKIYGKNYFSNYTKIVGAILLIMIVFYYFFYKNTLANLYNPSIVTDWIMQPENIVQLVLFMTVFLIVSMVFGILSISFPMIYLRKIEINEPIDLQPNGIVNEIKSTYFWRIFGFSIISIFIFVPIIMVVGLLSFALVFVIVGIPLLFIAIPAMYIWVFQAMYVYVFERKGFFDSLGRGWKIMFSNFWNIIGSTVALLIAALTVSGIVTMIPMMTTMSSILANGSDPSELYANSTMLIVNCINMLLSSILYNVMYVQQGLIYYSSLEVREGYQALSEIDNIGKNEE